MAKATTYRAFRDSGLRNLAARLMRWAGLGVLGLVLVLAACGDNEDESAQEATLGLEPGTNAIPCIELFDGRIFSTTDDLSVVCLDEAGELTVNEADTVNCADGRVLWWNDFAWGYLGESAVLHLEGEPPPEYALDLCDAS